MNDTMKKILIIIIALTFVISAYSCGSGGADTDTETETGTETGGMQEQTSPDTMKYGIIPGDYFFSSEYGGLLKYNVHNGTVSALCPDPFCHHDDESCQFDGVYSSTCFASIGNTVYYIHTDYETGDSAVYSFDADTAETNKVYSPGVPLSQIYSYEYRLLIRQYDSSDRGARCSYIWYDTKTGKTSALYKDEALDYYTVYSIINDRIIWKRYLEQEYYSTDLDGKDFIEYDFGYKYGNYYEMVEETYEDGTPYYDLYVTLKGETERKLLIQNTFYIAYCENKIIYTKMHPRAEWKVIRYFSKEYSIYDYTCGDVYVMDPDGSNDRLLIHTDEGIKKLTPGYQFHRMISGDLIGIELYWFDKDGGEYSGRIMTVDINTGEYVLSKPVWDDK